MNKKTVFPGNTKRCPFCLTVKPNTAEYFRTEKRNKDGLHSMCRECHRSKARAYQQAHKGEKVEYLRQWHINNKERENEKSKLWYQNNKEKAKALTKARKKLDGKGFPKSQWIKMLNLYNHKCLRCGSTEHLEPDHIIPISKGGKHTWDNMQPLCRDCNRWKFTKTIDFRSTNSNPPIC